MNIYETIENDAKNILLDTVNKSFEPKAFIIKDGNVDTSVSLNFSNDESKENSFQEVGELCSDRNCHEIVIVVDTWIREVKSKEESNYIGENWDTEKPSTYPDSMRENLLLIYRIDFKKTDFTKGVYYKNISGKNKIIKEETSDKKIFGNIRDALVMGFIIKEATKEFNFHESSDNVYEILIKKYPNLKAKVDNG